MTHEQLQKKWQHRHTEVFFTLAELPHKGAVLDFGYPAGDVELAERYVALGHEVLNAIAATYPGTPNTPIWWKRVREAYVCTMRMRDVPNDNQVIHPMACLNLAVVEWLQAL